VIAAYPYRPAKAMQDCPPGWIGGRSEHRVERAARKNSIILRLWVNQANSRNRTHGLAIMDTAAAARRPVRSGLALRSIKPT